MRAAGSTADLFRPFCAAAAIAAAVSLALAPTARAQSAPAVSSEAPSIRADSPGTTGLASPARPELDPSGTKPFDSSQSNASPVTSGVADPARSAGSASARSLGEIALDKVRQAAKAAGDILSRVPCLPPKDGVPPVGTLPHVAARLAAGEPVQIIAFGSSSTQGFGATAPEFTYPSRLAAQLRRHYPTVDITVVNAGRGGEDAPEMMKRLQSQVIDAHPDLVIWQVGTNAVLRNLDPDDIAKTVEDGIARLQAAGSDIVLVDPQYSPRVTEHSETAGKMVRLLGRVAQFRHVGIFPRFEVMRDWHERQGISTDSFVISDGLHMNDWGYACFAQLLGDDIIRSVGQIRIGVNVPGAVQTYRPM